MAKIDEKLRQLELAHYLDATPDRVWEDGTAKNSEWKVQDELPNLERSCLARHLRCAIRLRVKRPHDMAVGLGRPPPHTALNVRFGPKANIVKRDWETSTA